MRAVPQVGSHPNTHTHILKIELESELINKTVALENCHLIQEFPVSVLRNSFRRSLTRKMLELAVALAFTTLSTVCVNMVTFNMPP